MRVVERVITVLLLCVAGVRAQQMYFGIDYDAKAAYFNYQRDGVDEYVFSLNAVDNGDVYFHMSGPVAHCWIGVGFGSEMKDSFMILAYPSANGLDTTISPRIATGHTEPDFDPSAKILKVYNDTYAPNANKVTDGGTGTIIAHAVCLNCSTWATGALDITSKTQPFIFALGPNVTFRSDSPEASVPRHGLAGRFTMDMTEATNYTGWYGRVPAPNIPGFTFPPNDTAFASSNSQPAFDVITLNDPLPGAHAALMVLSFVLIFPSGALIMQFLKKTLLHAAVQVLGFCLVFSGFGLAVSFSRQYNKSKNFDSAHQVIGFIILAGLIIQLGLGIMHHSIYVRSQKPTPFGRIHFFLGPCVIALGIVNGGIGFHFAGNETWTVPYAIVVAVLVGISLAAAACFLLLRRRRKYRPEAAGASQYPPFAQKDDGEFEMREPSLGEVPPPEPYEATMPYSPTVPAPYSPAVPYTPISAYTPITPSTWKKEDLSRWPSAPYREFG